MIKNYYLKAGRKRYHSRENWAKIGTTTSYGLSTLKVVGNGRFLFSDSGHTFTSELIFFTFLLDLGLIKKWSVITPCLSLSAGYAPSVFGKSRILDVSLVFRIHIFWQMKKSSIFNSTLMFCGKVFTRHRAVRVRFRRTNSHLNTS